MASKSIAFEDVVRAYLVAVSGRDIAEILIKRGITSVEGCKDWLSSITDPRNGPEIIQDAVS